VTTGTEEASSDVQVLLLERLMVVRITGRVSVGWVGWAVG
jgi:hypothetical protein